MMDKKELLKKILTSVKQQTEHDASVAGRISDIFSCNDDVYYNNDILFECIFDLSEMLFNLEEDFPMGMNAVQWYCYDADPNNISIFGVENMTLDQFCEFVINRYEGSRK